MKILAINGSPNVNGSTAALIDIALEECKKSGAECEKVELVDYCIDCCTNCRSCAKNKECCQDDDFLHLKAKMLEADGLIIGSPYIGGKPDIRVRILMERLYPSTCYFGAFDGKYILGIASSATDDCKDIAKYCARLGDYGIFGNGIISGIVSENTMSEGIAKEFSEDGKVRERVIKAANNLTRDIERKRKPFSNIIKHFLLRKQPGIYIYRFMQKVLKKYSKTCAPLKNKAWVENLVKMEDFSDRA